MSVDIKPGSDEWMRLITPSKVAAIMGASRWESMYRLWHRMKGITPPEPDKDDFRVGHAFEPALAELWRTYPVNDRWQLSPGEVQIVVDSDRFGFPAAATLDRRARRGKQRRVVEFKTCRGLEEWGDEFTDEAPMDYALQVISQMLFTGFTKLPAHLMVLNKFGCGHHLYEIPFDQRIADAIIAECQLFWQSLSSDTPPPLDDSVATYECVREQHPEIDKDVEVEIPVEVAAEYHEALTAEEQAKTRARFAKTQVLDLMQRANYAFAGDERVARRQPAARDAVALYRIKPGSKAARAGAKTEQQHEEIA